MIIKNNSLSSIINNMLINKLINNSELKLKMIKIVYFFEIFTQNTENLNKSEINY